MGCLMSKNQVYSEVYAVLAALGDECIKKTPKYVLDYIAENRDCDYVVKIDKNLPLEEQNLSRDAIAVIAVLKLDYWCETDEERKELISILEANDQKEDELLKTDTRKWLRSLRGLKTDC